MYWYRNVPVDRVSAQFNLGVQKKGASYAFSFVTQPLRNRCFVVDNVYRMNRSHWWLTRISGVLVSILTSDVVDHGFEPGSIETKDYEIGICYFSATHAELRNKILFARK